MDCHECTLEFANLNQSSNKEKNKFYMKYVGKQAKDVDYGTLVIFSHISDCIKLYINSNPIQKDVLWGLYCPLSRYFCDPIRYEKDKKNNSYKSIDYLDDLSNEGD